MIIKTSKNVTAKEVYDLTKNPRTQKMVTAKGQRLELAAWALFEDTDAKSGELYTVCAIKTAEGDIFATNSPTFTRDFQEMVELFEGFGEDVHAINVISGQSKNGREFITCEYVC